MSVTVIRPAASAWIHIGDHIERLREYGDLLYTLSAHRISVRYKQTSLGVIWALLQPVMMMVVFTAVFAILAKMPSDGTPYALFAFTGLLPWTFFSTSVTSGAEPATAAKSGQSRPVVERMAASISSLRRSRSLRARAISG